MSAEKKWNLKDTQGKIYGPLTTEVIFDLIQKGFLSGEEELSPQNEERWTKLTKYPEFYEELVESLSRPQTQFTADDFENEISRSISKSQVQNLNEVKKTEAAVPPPPATPPPKRGKAVELEEKKSAVEISRPQTTSKPKPQETIDLVDMNIKYKKQKRGSPFFLFLVSLVVLFLVLFYLEEPTVTVEMPKGKISLVFPGRTGKPIPINEQRKMFQNALLKFESDSYEGYYQAQNILVGLIEANKKNADAISLLCLTYRELWPVAKKDSEDTQNLTRLVQLSQNENSQSLNAATCRAVQILLIGEASAADSVLQSSLEEYPTGAVLYEMRGEAMRSREQQATAISYLQKTQGLWPSWIKPYYKEAQFRKEMGDYNNAIIVLKNILKQNPKHIKSQILQGVIEVSHFNQKQGVDKILIGLTESEVDSELQFESYKALAYFYSGTQKQTALDYAKKAYAINPAEASLRSLILSVGGEAELNAVKSEDTQMVVLGDGYFKNKNYLAAQAQYKTAYDLNSKNATAAIKAAESLWRLNQSKEAIAWLQKAIKADPNSVDAYLKLADYQSQRFDFKAAADALASAKDKSKSTYQLLRAFAQVELRRQNPVAAIKFSEQALKLYDSDIESLNILSRSLLLTGDYEKAFRYIAKSVQLDSQNSESHEIYGQSLLGYKGFLVAQQYMQNLIFTRPNNSDYLYAYATVLHKDERYGDAIDSLNRTITMDPRNYKAWMLMGDSYQKTNQLNDALKSYFKAAGLDPTNSEPIFNVGLVYLQSKPNIAKAYKQFQTVIQTNPRYPRAYYFAGKAALLMGLTKQALEYSNMEKKLNPNLADPYILSAEIYSNDRNYSKATTELRNAVKLRPDDSNLYIMLAQNYRLSGQLDAADSMLRVASAKESGNAEIYKEQGAVYEKLGLTEKALSAYSRYIQLKPNAEDRAQIEAQIRSLGGGM